MMKNRFVSICYEGVSVLVMATFIIALVFTFFVRFIGVYGHSMDTTLTSGEWIVLSEIKPAYEPSYGDIVVISQPNGLNENIIKRVIATGGQEINFNFTTGAVFIDGHQIVEPYISTPTTNYYDISFPLTVPEGYCFVMGDNRQDSIDSRSSLIGLIDNRYILGRATFGITKSGIDNLKLDG